MITIQQINQFKAQAKKSGKSEAEIDAFINQKLNTQPQTAFSPKPQTAQVSTQPAPKSQPTGFWDKVKAGVGDAFRDMGQFAVGGAKGVASTVNNASALGQKGLNKITGLDEPISSLPRNAVTPTNKMQEVGFGSEQVAEFFTPGTLTKGLTKSLNVAGDGAKLGKFGTAAVRVGGKAAIEGTAAGTIRAAQTGSAKEGAKAGAVVGGIAGVAGVVGQLFRAARIPEWFQSKVFHNSADDMLQQLKTIGDAKIQKTNPELFKQLTAAGIVRTGKDGKIILNETLAKEALDRGLKGSIKNMATEVVTTARESEVAARTLAKSHTAPIKIEPQYVKLLQGVAKDYQDVGFGEVAKKAQDLVARIKNGQADATTALELRRFLDGMRTRFNPQASLSQSQQNFKTLADTLRQRIATEVPGMKSVMSDYRFSIDALEALAKEGNRRGNREAFNMLDTFLFGSGVATGNPIAGAGLGVTRRILNSPSGTTKIAQKLNNLGQGSSKTSSLIKAAAALISTRNKKQ